MTEATKKKVKLSKPILSQTVLSTLLIEEWSLTRWMLMNSGKGYL